MSKINTIIATSIACAGLMHGGIAQADYEWAFTGGNSSGVPNSANTCTSPNNANRTTYGNCGEWAPTPTGGPNVQATAWSNTGTDPAGAPVGNQIQNAYLAAWSGNLGVINRTEGGNTTGTPTASSPNHSLDNSGQYDSILLSFDSAISLTGVRIGWPDGAYDSDITVLAYTGGGSFSGFSSSATYESLTASGWTLVGHYADADRSPSSTDPALAIDTDVTSRYWLIGAYNPLVGGTSSSADTSCQSTSGKSCDTYTKDYVKILAVTGVNSPPPGPGRVPEPSAWMLLFASAGAAVVAGKARGRRPSLKV